MQGKLALVVFTAVFVATFAEEPTAFPEDVTVGYSGTSFAWEAAGGQFPHQLNLRSVGPQGTVSTCGASLIHLEWGLTAAHCTAGRVSFVVRGGMVNLTRPATIFETTRYFIHPLYNEAHVGIVQSDDISLLAFGRILRLTDSLQPVRLQNRQSRNRNYQGVQLVASGWGRPGTSGTSENLSWVYLRGTTNVNCALHYGTAIVTSSTICAGAYAHDNALSICQVSYSTLVCNKDVLGESGGPLTAIDNDGRVTLVGVTSFVHLHGCQSNRPAGFVRPGHYHDWFNAVTRINLDWQ